MIIKMIFFCFSVYFFVINTNVSVVPVVSSIVLYKVNTRIFYLVYNALNDLYAVTPAYLLILFSTPFKRKLIKFLGYVHVIYLF